VTGREVIPAHACLLLWETGGYPGDAAVREEWGDASS
jgi:hypothetical protein